MIQFDINQWRAWAPGMESADDWAAWAVAPGPLADDGQPDVSADDLPAWQARHQQVNRELPQAMARSEE
ncbi:MAG TPA: hypothetical protein DCR66_06495, partial [Pseudomonas sp.]|nr:hypothetical protein [Pseudomonas sp.]